MRDGIVDHSEAIAVLRAHLSVLTDLDPDGKWKTHRLVKSYQQNRYSLTRGQARDLYWFLRSEVNRVHSEHLSRNYAQLDLLGDAPHAPHKETFEQ